MSVHTIDLDDLMQMLEDEDHALRQRITTTKSTEEMYQLVGRIKEVMHIASKLEAQYGLGGSPLPYDA